MPCMSLESCLRGTRSSNDGPRGRSGALFGSASGTLQRIQACPDLQAEPGGAPHNVFQFVSFPIYHFALHIFRLSADAPKSRGVLKLCDACHAFNRRACVQCHACTQQHETAHHYVWAGACGARINVRARSHSCSTIAAIAEKVPSPLRGCSVARLVRVRGLSLDRISSQSSGYQP